MRGKHLFGISVAVGLARNVAEFICQDQPQPTVTARSIAVEKTGGARPATTVEQRALGSIWNQSPGLQWTVTRHASERGQAYSWPPPPSGEGGLVIRSL